MTTDNTKTHEQALTDLVNNELAAGCEPQALAAALLTLAMALAVKRLGLSPAMEWMIIRVESLLGTVEPSHTKTKH